MFVGKNEQRKKSYKFTQNTVKNVEKIVFAKNRLTKNLYYFGKIGYCCFGDKNDTELR